jgi:deoxyinosine 3'endonuclease (endonuclease V)
MIEKAVHNWHHVMENNDVVGLDALLADDAVFHSPVVHTPQIGKAITKLYLSAAFKVFYNDTFIYVRELMSGKDAVLEFKVEIDGIIVNGVDMITCNDAGQIVDFKVMIRPLKAVHLIQQKMGEMMQKK